ncbi:Membrane protein [Deinococcus saxicola]|uniref:hypothetical protein n=1 Tax=Deinococcus saxicola TaxID=249406 RepID=UPI0039EFE6FC
MTAPQTTVPQPTPRTPPVFAISALVAVVASVLLIAFGLPAVNAGPHDLPLALVAPPPVAQQLQTRLDTARPGAFDLHVKASEDEARAAILNREVYGALLVTPQGPRVLTASAASPTAAQLIAALPALTGAPAGADAVQDIVPATASDPRQAGMISVALPLVLGGILSAVFLTRFFPSARMRVLGAAGVGLLGGFLVAAILQFWFGTLAGNYLTNSLAVALGVFAIGSFILGLEALAGFIGLGLGAAIMMLLGNPLSALSSAPELLPAGWGALGQLLPPGAFGTLLRSVAFFDGAGWGKPALTLGVWVALGLILTVIGSARRKSAAPFTEAGAARAG